MIHEGAQPVSIRPASGCERFSHSVFQKDDHKGAQLRADQAFDSIRFAARTNRAWHDHRNLLETSDVDVSCQWPKSASSVSFMRANDPPLATKNAKNAATSTTTAAAAYA